VSLSRVATLAPRAALSLAGQAGRRAVTNARLAAELVTEQVADRRRLAPADDDTPGGLSRLSREECAARLRSRHVARLAYIARAGLPDVVPVNYVLNGDDILIRSGPGPKLQAAERGEMVAVEIDDVDEDAHTGWSVVAVGRATRLSTAERYALPAQMLPETWARGPRSAVIRVRPSRVDGRQLH
jgi:nitroimidazol reductase NimA-like FMN-containing flavoprotein (pyridoxamine 5'-phosphate oxidase superfamily)